MSDPQHPRDKRRRPVSASRILYDGPPTDRRTFLRMAALAGGAMPAQYFSFAAAQTETPTLAQAGDRPLRDERETATGIQIVRDFADPYLELVRLLREATEVEHALMIQYLYCAFSLRPAFEALRGNGLPNTTDLLGIAVQEMQHLGAVNRLLVALGAAPNFLRQDFPYEPDIYPFEFSLEPLSQRTAAMYVYTEAPADACSHKESRRPRTRSIHCCREFSARAREPALNERIVGAYYNPADGHLRPDRYVAELARRVRERGGTILEQEPVLALHGWPQHWYVWRAVIPRIAPHARVICPDLRGFGWTDVPGGGYLYARGFSGEDVNRAGRKLVDELLAGLDDDPD